MEYTVRAARITDVDRLVALSGGLLGARVPGQPGAADLLRQLVFLPHASVLVAERRRCLSRRATLLRAAEIYAERFARPSGRIAATFEVLFLHGWVPHVSQQKPLKPGTAANRLADALGVPEHRTGIKVERS